MRTLIVNQAWSPHAYAMVTDTYHSVLHLMGLPDPEYKFQRLVRYIENNVKPRLRPTTELVITGHSLGGGIAHIVAVMVNAPAIAFNPPGAYQSLSKHLYWNDKQRRQMHEAAHNRTVTILAENDIIGKLFDTHAGLVQTITCSTDQIGPLGCHMIENSVCNLLRHCSNDPRWKVPPSSSNIPHPPSFLPYTPFSPALYSLLSCPILPSLLPYTPFSSAILAPCYPALDTISDWEF